MEPDMYEVIKVMKSRGGAFIEGLAKLWEIADSNNREKIEAAWVNEFDRYREFCR